MNKLKVFLILILVLSACGPVYKTDYTYIPPKTESGRSCIFQCQNTKVQCEQLQELKYERCLDRADREYDRCERNKRYIYKPNGERKCVDNCYCFRDSCSLDEETCEIRYRSCYGTCGGSVEAKTYCVSNCEKANPGVPTLD
ncbi:MAG: hypothetical protein R3A13_00765 [Bdellovibrionota bacterium]